MKKVKKWCTLLVFVPFIIFFVFTNYYIDPANIFHDASKEIAAEILSGNSVYNNSANTTDREIKHNIIREMPKHVDCVAIGSSVIQEFSKEQVGGEVFFNLGVNGSDFYDMLAQIAALEIYGIEVDRLVLSVDSYFFYEKVYSSNSRNLPLKPYADYMLDVLYEKEPQMPSTEVTASVKIKLEQLFSVTYFQAAMEYVNNRGQYSMENTRWGLVGDDFDGSKSYYASDGRLVRAEASKIRDEDHVKQDSEKYNIEHYYAKDQHLREYECEVFEKLIQYLIEKDIDVDLYLCPVAPALWNRLEAEIEHYPMLIEMEDYANEIAEKYGLDVIGTYNPYNLGITNEEFHDARHVRYEVFSKYFDIWRD